MKTFSKAIALPIVAALVVTMVEVPLASARTDVPMPITDFKKNSAASAALQTQLTDLSAGRKHRRAVRGHAVRRHGGNAAAMAMFGMVAGTIAQIAAADAYRDRGRVVYYDDGYAYGGYGYYEQPRYYYRQPYVAPATRHHRYNAPQYVPQVRHYRHGGHPIAGAVPQVHPHRARHWEGPGGR